MTLLQELKKNVNADTIGRKRDGSGNYLFRKGFYYRFGTDAQKYAKQVSFDLCEMNQDHDIVDYGEKYTAFRGGASVANQSHFWVVVKMKEA